MGSKNMRDILKIKVRKHRSTRLEVFKRLQAVCVCLFPFTVEDSPDSNKIINVMPEIRPAMLC